MDDNTKDENNTAKSKTTQDPIAPKNKRKKKVKCTCPNCQILLSGGEKIVDSEGTKLHNCNHENCNMVFKKVSHLVSHLRRHRGKRHYTCGLQNCKRQFYEKYDLNRHMRSHSGNRPHACEWPNCGKNFTQYSSLKTHFLLHEGRKKHACEVCSYKCLRIGDLKKHVRTHEKKKIVRKIKTVNSKRKIKSLPVNNKKQLNQQEFNVSISFQCKHQLQYLDQWWPKDLKESNFLAVDEIKTE